MQGELTSASSLRIDLDSGEIWVNDLNSSWAAPYAGGMGSHFRYLLEEMKPRLDPRSSENASIIATRPLAGTGVATGPSLQEYYRLRGWDEASVQTKATLSSLFSTDDLASLCSGPAPRGRKGAPMPDH